MLQNGLFGRILFLDNRDKCMAPEACISHDECLIGINDGRNGTWRSWAVGHDGWILEPSVFEPRSGYMVSISNLVNFVEVQAFWA